MKTLDIESITMDEYLENWEDGQRMVLIGNYGDNTEAFAKSLAKEFNIPYVNIDVLFREFSDTAQSLEHYEAAHAKLISQANWVIYGLGHWESIKIRMARATYITLLDTPVWMNLCEVAENPALQAIIGASSLKEAFQKVWEIDQNGMPKLRRWVRKAKMVGVYVNRYSASLNDQNQLIISDNIPTDDGIAFEKSKIEPET